MRPIYYKLLIVSIAILSIFSLTEATEIESGYAQATSTGTITENIGFRPDYIEFITAQQIESVDFSESDPENNDCPDNANGWSEGSVLFNDSGVEKQFSIGMFRSSDSTNGHITASSSSHVIRNIYTSQDGNECGRLEASVTNVNDNGFDLEVEEKYSNYNEIIRYKAYQFPDNMGFEAGMIEVNSEGNIDVSDLGFQPANLHFRAGQQITSKDSVSDFWRAPAGRSKGYTTLDEDGDVIDQQSIGTASSSDSTNAHRSIASDEYVINTVYVDQNANLMDGGEPSRLEAKVAGADEDGFTLQVDNEWSSTDEVILYRAWGYSYYDFDIGYRVISGTSTESFNTGFEPDAIDVYAEQQIQSINDEVVTPSNSRCDNAGGWSNGYYERSDNSQWTISTGRTSDSQDSHRYGSSNSEALMNIYNYDGNDCGNFYGEVVSTDSSGFEMSFNSDGDFDSNYGSEMVYYRAFNFEKAPPSIESLNIYNSSTEHKFGLVANISEGSNDISSCEITAESDSGDSRTYSGTAISINETWSQCEYEWIEYNDVSTWEDRHNNNDELLNLDVSLNASDVDGLYDVRTSSNKFPNHEPDITDISFSDYPETHAFNVSAILEDTDATNPLEIDNCQMRFTDDGSNSVNVNPPINYSYGNDNQAKCFYSSVNSSMPFPSDNDNGFEPDEDIDTSVEIEDHHGSYISDLETNPIPNRPPIVSILEPKNSEAVLDKDAMLKITVDDPEGDNIELIEYWDDTENNLIQSISNPPDSDGEGTFTVDWQDLDLGEYKWTAEVHDKWSTGDAGPATFERLVSQIYRVRHTVDHQYSSLIVDEGGQASMFFESDVATDNRTVTTYVEGDGIDVEYSDGSTQKTYEVDTGEPDRFQLRIEALDTGSNELRIITEDDSVSTNTTTTFPVYVRESVKEGQSVPGLSLYYLVFIGLFSSLLYFALL